MIVKITFDTNCFFDYFRRDATLIQELIDLQEMGVVEIAMTTRVMADTFDKVEGVSSIWKSIQSFPSLEVVGTVFRLDVSRLDSGDYLASDTDVSTLERLRGILIDAQLEDVDHLFGHLKAKRDIFVTSDHHFLDHQERLKKEFNVLVFNPKDALIRIKNVTSKNSGNAK
jgi:hypothetical protein